MEISNIEIWKDVNDCNYLQVSSYGRINNIKTNKIYYGNDTSLGYKVIYINGKNKYVHRLIYKAFNDIIIKGMVIDHIDGNKLNNNINNLQQINNRHNCSKDKHKLNKSSKYVGVSFNNSKQRFEANIKFNGKNYRLGTFNNELDAFNAYIDILKLGVNYVNKYKQDSGKGKARGKNKNKPTSCYI